VIGMQKVTTVSANASLRVAFEVVALQERAEERPNSRSLPVYYTHSEITQGYTHRGQLLGAWVGPGADAQFLAVDALLPNTMTGFFVERVRRADVSAAAYEARRFSPYDHDTEVTFGVRSLLFPIDGFSLALGLARSFRYNRDFLHDDVNWSFEIETTWTPVDR